MFTRIAAVAFLFLAIAPPARAALVDFTGAPGNGTYAVSGTIAPDATATFEYTVIPGVTPTAPGSLSSSLGTIVPPNVTTQPFSIGNASLECNLYSGTCSSQQVVSYYLSHGTNTTTPTPISPLLQIIFNAIDTNHGNVTFVNDNSLSASFTSALNPTGHLGFIQLASDSRISPVPLPAALPLFGTALAGLGGAGWWKRRKVSRNRQAP